MQDHPTDIDALQGWPMLDTPAFWGDAARNARRDAFPRSVQAKGTNRSGDVQFSDRSTRWDGHAGVEVRHLSDGTVVLVPRPEGTGPCAVAVTGDGSLIAIGDSDGKITLHDGHTGEHIADMLGHRGVIYSLDFSPDDSRLASASRDRTCRLWHVGRRETVLVLDAHDDYVHSAKFSPDGSRLVTASGDTTIRIWDARPHSER